ncbi:unannotated protein [freshwater metagenome]|uniref:Unannotated protein n=1 Tax=freshwater metagenome TaxID=449393 RepID=A0A6J7G7J4_9ZZZZ
MSEKAGLSGKSALATCAPRTGATNDIYGDGQSSSKNSDERSARTIGANGRNDSRFLMLKFSRRCIEGDRGSAKIERLPRARGPNSIRPEHIPRIAPSARRSATLPASSAESMNCSHGRPSAVKDSQVLVSLGSGPTSAPFIESWPAGSGRSLPQTSCQAHNAQPRADPASPAAGCTQTSLKGPSRRSLPFATQFRATPPPRTAWSEPVSVWAWCATRRTTSSRTTWMERARSHSRRVIGAEALRGGPSNN